LGVDRYHTCNKAVSCAKWIIDVVKYGVNPILGRYGYPEAAVKIGMDIRENVVSNMHMIKAHKLI